MTKDIANLREFSFPKNKIKFLLLEGVHPVAVSTLKNAGYSVVENAKSLSPDDLMKEIVDAHVVGIRSKTKITKDHFAAAKKLLAVGCFGVGTNQVDLEAATTAGVPVFNAPYGNTRSVAELTLGSMIMIARKAADKNIKMHQGFWDKSAKGACEVRNKTLGVVGYGHIGQQVGLLAEAIGMRVVFYDRMKRLPLGNARAIDTMDELLASSDFITLHVPSVGAEALIGKKELSKMKPGSFLLNFSRGTLVDFSALKEALQSKHLAGAAIDVYPQEPKSNQEPFETELKGVDNVLLTPHLGGSTEEAQYNIGQEVAAAFIKFINAGSTSGAVNFPQLDAPAFPNSHRILNVHRNIPGVLSDVNKIISDVGANIDAQYLSTFKNIGYLIMDVDKAMSDEVRDKIAGLDANIKTRILF